MTAMGMNLSSCWPTSVLISNFLVKKYLRTSVRRIFFYAAKLPN